ncbi:MAG: uridylate kinase [Archaeoglobaceae archaeon]
MKEENRVVVKLGGSCSSRLQELILDLKECAERGGVDILIIPGGWVFADLVRKLEVDDTTAHWMAVKAMDLYGNYISSYGADTIEPSQFGFNISGVNVLLPYRLLRKYDELNHSWEVTSDSIALWVAHKLGFKEIVKLTDVDGVLVNGRLVKEIEAENVARLKTCVDGYSPALMQEFGVDMFVCNGLKGRVKDYILRDRAEGTRIKAHKY